MQMPSNPLELPHLLHLSISEPLSVSVLALDLRLRVESFSVKEVSSRHWGRGFLYTLSLSGMSSLGSAFLGLASK